MRCARLCLLLSPAALMAQEQVLTPRPPGRNLLGLLGLDHYIETQWLLRLLAAALALVLALIAYRLLIAALARLAAHHRLIAPIESDLKRILRWIFLPVALLFAMQQAHFDVGGILTMISGILALIAIGFVAVWSMISNVLAAFLISSTRLFRHGQIIQFTNVLSEDGCTGRVRELRLLYTVIEEIRADGRATGDGTLRIPNNFFFQNPIRVFDQPPPQLFAAPEPSPASPTAS